jgi:regulator of replication initiation timing
MTTEQMIETVDSYYLNRSGGNEKLMKCSLIAAYATELGFLADGYDFRRNTEVREHIERLKVCAETCSEVCSEKYLIPAYKTLDVDGFIRNNGGNDRLAESLRELDIYWNRIYEYSERALEQNRTLMKEKAGNEAKLRETAAEIERLTAKNSMLSGDNGKLSVENRYLRKMLRVYLYPAVADEILRSENDPPQTDTAVTDAAVCDFIESDIPKSFEASVSQDDRIQSEAEHLIERLWEKCNE